MLLSFSVHTPWSTSTTSRDGESFKKLTAKKNCSRCIHYFRQVQPYLMTTAKSTSNLLEILRDDNVEAVPGVLGIDSPSPFVSSIIIHPLMNRDSSRSISPLHPWTIVKSRAVLPNKTDHLPQGKAGREISWSRLHPNSNLASVLPRADSSANSGCFNANQQGHLSTKVSHLSLWASPRHISPR